MRETSREPELRANEPLEFTKSLRQAWLWKHQGQRKTAEKNGGLEMGKVERDGQGKRREKDGERGNKEEWG